VKYSFRALFRLSVGSVFSAKDAAHFSPPQDGFAVANFACPIARGICLAPKARSHLSLGQRPRKNQFPETSAESANQASSSRQSQT
jgi:hypothetical protein